MRTMHTADLFGAILPAFRFDGKAAPLHVWHYADPADAAAACPMSAPASAWDRDAWSTRDEMRDKSACRDMAAAQAMARDGWKEGAERAAAIRDRMQTARPRPPRTVTHAFAGAVPNVPRMLGGNPVHMRARRETEAAARPIITLVSDMAYSWNIEASVIMRAAVAAAVVVDVLEDAGFRCEVLGIARGQRDNLCREHAIRAKAAHEPMNLAKFAFVVGHPGFKRRILFGLFGIAPELRPMTGSFGHPCPTRPDEATRCFVLPNAGKTPRDDAHALANMLADLRQQGCPGIPND